jgi:hypothetical protein
MELTPELVVAVVAAVIALVLDVVPGLSSKWEALPKEVKRFTWLVGCLLVGVGAWVVSCVLNIGHYIIVVCTASGFLDALQIAFLAYFSSQATHGVVTAVGGWLRGGQSELSV